MQAVSSDECYNCGELGHRRKSCPKAQRRKQQQPRSHKPNTEKKIDGQGKYCSYHQGKIHDNSECFKQKELQQQAGAFNVTNIGNPHLSAQTAEPEQPNFGYPFSAARASPITEGEKAKTPVIKFGPTVAQLRMQRAADTLELLGALTEPQDGTP